jgi:hypothetical protein
VDIVTRLDSVEVKVTLGEEHVVAALKGLGLTAAKGPERLIYFCEDVTPQTSAGTPLLGANAILRVRTRSGDKGDTTVKPRPARQPQLSARWVPVQEVEYGEVKEELKVQAGWSGMVGPWPCRAPSTSGRPAPRRFVLVSGL